MRAVIILILLVGLALPVTGAVPVFAGRYAVEVDGETALGYVAYPTGAAPTTLLVFGHGCCGKPDQTSFVQAYAAAYGVAVVAMDYRGPGGWDVMKGHRDLLAATEDLQATFPIDHTVIWGISMGGETTGMAVAARPDLYDHWVDTFGVTNLIEEFATLGLYPGASLDGNNELHSWMIDEAGGTPATAPQAYIDRSPALMTGQMVGLKRAYIAHGVGDLIVPYSMSRETYTGLIAAGVPVTLHTVTTGGGGVQGPWTPAGSTGAPMCVNVPTLGCAAEVPATPVGLAAHDGRGGAPSYQIIDALLRGLEPDAAFAFREHIVDQTAGVTISLPP